MEQEQGGGFLSETFNGFLSHMPPGVGRNSVASGRYLSQLCVMLAFLGEDLVCFLIDVK